MAWFRLDDAGAFHEKVLLAGNEAFGAWCRMGQQSSLRMLDGFVPTVTALAITTQRVVDRLVSAVLLERDAPRDGYVIHDFLAYNPSAADITAERERKAEQTALAGKRGGVASGIARRKASRDREATSKRTRSEHEAARFTVASVSLEAGRSETKPRPDPDPDPDLQKEIAGEGTVEPERIASVDPVVAALRAEPLLSEADLVGFAGELRSHGMNIGLCGAKGDARWLACLEFALVSLHARAMERPIDAPLAYLRKILKDTAPPRRLEQAIKDRVEAEKPRERAQIQARYPVAVVSEDFAANAVTEMATPDRTSTARPPGAMPTVDERRRMVAEISSFVGPLAAAGGSR